MAPRSKAGSPQGCAAQVLAAARALRCEVEGLRFGPPVSHVYNPLDYAWEAYAAYVERYAATPKQVVFLGMNPGPFGMVQTGVPFGDAGLVTAWLRLDARVEAPARQHPRRPVYGFACPRGEVSGQRLWGAAKESYGTPERFFAARWVANYCPLAFLEGSGRNRTPDKLPPRERQLLFAACDAHLRRLVEALRPRWVIGVGRFAEQRAAQALAGLEVEVGTVLHPSPASPAANQGWAAAVRAQLQALGLCR